MDTAPCRLFVYLARDAPVGVVLRRGPSSWARLSLWQTEHDEIKHGQWFRGRIYERRSDLSSDGSLFLAFARKDGTRSPDMEQVDSWLALSRPPWFTALALWPVGGTYALGGYFTTPTSIFVGGSAEPRLGRLPFWLSSGADLPEVDRSLNWTDRGVYFRRLLRDGWTEAPDSVAGRTWQRVDPSGQLILTMTHTSNTDYQAFGGPHVVEYSVRSKRGTVANIGHATWADWDQRGRLVVAQQGRLLHWKAAGDQHEIADFNGQRPETFPAPDWAGTWPRRPMHARARGGVR